MESATTPKRDRVDRNAVQASYWQFEPDLVDATVEAMPSSLSIVRSDDRVLIAVRGKQGRRHEASDSVWLEMTDSETVRLIARLAAAVSS